MNIPEYPTSEGLKPVSKKVKAFAGIAIAATAAAIGTGIFVTNKEIQDIEKKREEEKQQLATTFAEDGFKYLYHWNTGATIDLGACTLSDVSFEVIEDTNKTIVDTRNYSFHGIAYPNFYEQLVTTGKTSSHREIRVKGPGATFEFESIEELQSNILGDEPCKTLANQITTQNFPIRIG